MYDSSTLKADTVKLPIVFICFGLSLMIVRSQIVVPAWSQFYDGPQNSTDQATAMAVDGAGNVFVTGQSIGSANLLDYDYATIKYSGDGVPLWTNRYNGPAHRRKAGTALMRWPWTPTATYS